MKTVLLSTLRLSSIPAAAALLVILAACDSGTEQLPADLDARLRQTIEAAAGGGGLSFFMLPDSGALAALPQDPRNPLTPEKVELGRLLFHETALAVDPMRPEGRGTYSCATCHHASAGFQAGRRQAIGEGGSGFARAGAGRSLHASYGPREADAQPIRTLATLNGAWQRVTFWNGQFGAAGPNAGTKARWQAGTPQAVNRLGYEGLETQAIEALSSHRMEGGAEVVAAAYPRYRQLFARAFPDRTGAAQVTDETAGLAIAAYERTLVAEAAPFQRWLRGDLEAMTSAQKRGAELFFGEAACVDCHTGPALAADAFHALGMGDLEGTDIVGKPDLADPVHLGRGGFTGRSSDHYRFKTPQLYNLADHAAFGHGATFTSIREVVIYKNEAVPQSPYVSSYQLAESFRPLDLSEAEVDDLTAFLERGLRDPDLRRYVPHALPSGGCVPANDAQSRRDLGCERGGKPAP